MNNNLDLSLIFINYYSKESLKNVLFSIKNYYDENLEIIIFNNSPEEKLEDLKEIYLNIKIINSEKNLGFTKGCNIAVNNSNKKYILILNPDILFINEFISYGIKFLEENKDFGAVGFKILNPDGTIQKESLRNFPTPLNTLLRFLNLDSLLKIRYSYFDRELDKSKEANILSGACMLIRKEAFLNINGFDESFFLYGDDIDLCIRLKNKGWKLYYLPIESVIHYKGGSLYKYSFKRIFYSHRAMFLFSKKYYSKNLILLLIIYSGIILRFIFLILISILIRFSKVLS